ncbi:hypothetical protein SDC9_141344 [bioreactor metagenome]|uniref:Uncharacterized protein n=1 Tax=bioreactor metagenome TaxID=1076179 RepID=A0A645DY53_9ZZZZ
MVGKEWKGRLALIIMILMAVAVVAIIRIKKPSHQGSMIVTGDVTSVTVESLKDDKTPMSLTTTEMMWIVDEYNFAEGADAFSEDPDVRIVFTIKNGDSLELYNSEGGDVFNVIQVKDGVEKKFAITRSAIAGFIRNYTGQTGPS